MTLDSPDARARRFLDACAGIEKILANKYNRGKPGFYRSVQAAGEDPLVRRNQTALGVFIELRNVLSHEAYQQGEPIAAPLTSTVEAIERILSELTTPQLALSFAARQPLTADTREELSALLRKMVESDISQVPVLGSGGMKLLTTNAIARWVAAHLEDDGTVLIATSYVEDVLSCGEYFEKLKVVDRRWTAARALDELTKDEPPLALVLTESGRQSEKPLGILTAADIPKLSRVVSVAPF